MPNVDLVLANQMAQDVVSSLTPDENNCFNYLFTLQNDTIWFGKKERCFGTGSFANKYTDLLTFFTQVAMVVGNNSRRFSNCSYDRAVVKCTAYLYLTAVHCIGVILDKKKDVIFKGATHDWSFGAIGDKYRKMYIYSSGDTFEISFILWPTGKNSDLIKILVSFDAYRDEDYLTKVVQQKFVKVKVQRYAPNQMQKTVQVTLSELWPTIKNGVKIITEKTAI